MLFRSDEIGTVDLGTGDLDDHERTVGLSRLVTRRSAGSARLRLLANSLDPFIGWLSFVSGGGSLLLLA